MPFSRLCAVPHDVNVLFPEFVREACKVHITRLACIAHAIAQAVNQTEAWLIRGRIWFGSFFETGPSFEISNFVFPVAGAHASRDLPVHKHAGPGIEPAEQFRICYLDRTFQLAAAYDDFVQRRLLVSHGDRTAEQRVPCGRCRMPLPVGSATEYRASIRTIERLARPG